MPFSHLAAVIRGEVLHVEKISKTSSCVQMFKYANEDDDSKFGLEIQRNGLL